MTSKAGRTAAHKEQKLARSFARLGAVQALYQMDIGGADTQSVMAEFELHRLQQVDSDELGEADIPLFRDIVQGVVRHQKEIDPQVNTHLAEGWRLNRLDSTLRAILRAGTFELGWYPDTPVRVVLDEYVELAHDFFPDDESKVVNGVLDALARELRAHELSA